MGQIANRNSDAITKDVAAILARRWDIDAAVKLIGNVENCVFEVGDNYVARATELIHRTPDALAAELDWVLDLASRGLPVAAPIPSNRHRLIEPAGAAGVHVSVFQRAPGIAFDDSKHWTRAVLASLGRLLGKIHVASRSYAPPPRQPRRHSWQEWVATFSPRLPARDDKILELFEAQRAWHKSLPQSPETYGLVHYDAHDGNLFVKPDSTVTLFDFDDACYNYFAADLMIPIYYAQRSFDHHRDSIPAREILIDAYLAEHSLDQAWLDRIDDFCHLRDLTLYIWGSQMFDYDNLAPHHKQYFESRRTRILEGWS